MKRIILILSVATLLIGGCGSGTTDKTIQPSPSPVATPASITAPAPVTSPTPASTVIATPVHTEPVKPSPSPAVSPTITPTPLPIPTNTTVPIPSPTGTPETDTSQEPEQVTAAKGHFGFMPASWDFDSAREAGGTFDRPFFELFQWGRIEPQPGMFDFTETDQYVQEAQQYGFHIVANIQPRADWDQSKCHQVSSFPSLDGPTFSPTDKPCDMQAYGNFVTALVERYDGDGYQDMPELTVPIKHWEVMNEVGFTDYFTGSPADYFQILKTTSQAAKAADPEAIILQGGMAGMMPECSSFCQGIFDLGGADYIDVFNMHSIGHGEHLNIPAFKDFLGKNSLTEKPIWVTEVQFQQSDQTQNYTAEDFAKILARSYIFALANGVDKLLYVNIKMPPHAQGVPFDQRSALIDDQGNKTPLFYAHLTIARMLGDLSKDDHVDIMREHVGSWHVDEGEYKFTIDGKTIYALWGTGSLPAGITGQVKVTNMSGKQNTVEASSIRLSDSPIFVEIE